MVYPCHYIDIWLAIRSRGLLHAIKIATFCDFSGSPAWIFRRRRKIQASSFCKWPDSKEVEAWRVLGLHVALRDILLDELADAIQNRSADFSSSSHLSQTSINLAKELKEIARSVLIQIGLVVTDPDWILKILGALCGFLVGSVFSDNFLRAGGTIIGVLGGDKFVHALVKQRMKEYLQQHLIKYLSKNVATKRHAVELALPRVFGLKK